MMLSVESGGNASGGAPGDLGTARQIYWLEQRADDVPAEHEWLAGFEKEQVAGLRIAARRRDWLLGRWTAKCALAIRLGRGAGATIARPLPLAKIAIRSRSDGAPEALLDGVAVPWQISISHRGGLGLCALADRGAGLGCDIELIEPRSADLVADFFTQGEQAWFERTGPAERDRIAALIWSAKESALKGLGEGLRLDTRSVEVELIKAEAIGGWQPLRVSCAEHGEVFHGWWRDAGDHLMTIASAAECAPPNALCTTPGSAPPEPTMASTSG